MYLLPIASFMCVVMIIIGFIGNVTVCTVILCNRSMHTITNIYLFNLSVSDLLILVANLTAEIYQYFHLYEYEFGTLFSWRSIEEWISKLAIGASSLIITTFTFERYLAICRPFMVQSMPSKSRVKKIIIALWLIAAILSLVAETGWFIMTTPIAQHLSKKYQLTLWISEVTCMFLHFLIPIIAITVMYTLIGLELRKSSKMAEIVTRTGDRDIGKTLKMFVFIIAAFFFCWAPYYLNVIFDMIRYTDYHIPRPHWKVMTYTYVVKTVTSVVYPSLNPLIYSIMSTKFRTEIKNLLSKSRRNFPGSTTNSTQPSSDITLTTV